MLNAQESSLALSNLAQAQALSAATPDRNDCCSVNGYSLQINFERNTKVYEDCTVVPVEALMFYPENEEGTVKVCVSFPTVSVTSGAFEVYNLGDFTAEEEPVAVPGRTEICSDVSFPVLNQDGDDLNFVRSNFFITTFRGNVQNEDRVPNIYGRIEGNDNIDVECSCEEEDEDPNDDMISSGPFTFSFSKDKGRSQFITSSGRDLSTLDPFCAYCLPAVGSENTRSDVYIYGQGQGLRIDAGAGSYSFGQSGQSRPYTLTLGPDFKISIEDGATLDLTAVEIEGCEEMWDAIIVEDGGELIMSPGFWLGGAVRSKVSGGKRGIVVEQGGKLTVDNTIFTENLVGVTTQNDNTRKSPEINIYGSEFNFGERVVEEEIVIQPFLLNPHFGEKPRAGIELFDVEDGFVIDYGLLLEAPSRFENLEHGIILNESSAVITGTQFSRMRTTEAAGSGSGILVNDSGIISGSRDFLYVDGNLDHPSGGVSFEDSKYGVNAFDPYNIRIRNTDFTNLDYGVHADDPYRLKVYDSNFDTWVSGITALRRKPGLTWIRRNDFYARSYSAQTGNAIRVAGVTDFFSEWTEVKENNFTLDSIRAGVYVTNQVRLTLLNNNFTWEREPEKAVTVLVEGGVGTRALGNFITSNDTKLKATGFDFNTANSVDLNCNRMEELLVGAKFFGNNALSRIRGNIMKDLKTGLQVGNPGDQVFNSSHYRSN